VPLVGQVKGRRPSAVTVAAQHGNSHLFLLRMRNL
jgi:hypothetical protein